MPTPVRVGAGRAGQAAQSSAPAPTYADAQSVYGNTRGDSVGYNPRNPKAYWATQAAKAYQGSGESDDDFLLGRQSIAKGT